MCKLLRKFAQNACILGVHGFALLSHAKRVLSAPPSYLLRFPPYSVVCRGQQWLLRFLQSSQLKGSSSKLPTTTTRNHATKSRQKTNSQVFSTLRYNSPWRGLIREGQTVPDGLEKNGNELSLSHSSLVQTEPSTPPFYPVIKSPVQGLEKRTQAISCGLDLRGTLPRLLKRVLGTREIKSNPLTLAAMKQECCYIWLEILLMSLELKLQHVQAKGQHRHLHDLLGAKQNCASLMQKAMVEDLGRLRAPSQPML